MSVSTGSMYPQEGDLSPDDVESDNLRDHLASVAAPAQATWLGPWSEQTIFRRWLGLPWSDQGLANKPRNRDGHTC